MSISSSKCSPNSYGLLPVQRWYSSTLGQFLTADPYQASGGVTSPASWNRYVYSRGDPINRYDPAGLEDSMPAPELPPEPGTVPAGSSMDFLLRMMLGSINTMGQYVAAYSTVMPLMMAQQHQPKLTPRQREEIDRNKVKKGIYDAGAADPIFGGAILDCIAGVETNWDVSKTLGKGTSTRIGLFQFNAQSWAATGTDLDFPSAAVDPFKSATVKITGLYRALAQVVSPMTTKPYTDDQIKEAIRRNGDGTAGYVNAVWNCAQEMKAGHAGAGIDFIDAYQRP